jgi:acetyltransferase-like isoleucine patch superfamily enzyme
MITIDPTAHIGQCVCLVVGSHDTKPGQFGRVLARPLVIKARAQIYSFAQLFSCTIGEDSIVAMGTVVRSMDVPPGCMVEGNPARIIKRLVGGKWIRV